MSEWFFLFVGIQMKDTFFIADKIPVRVIKSARASIAIQVKEGGDVIVRAPKGMSMSKIRRFVAAKEAWIVKHVEQIQKDWADRPRREPYTPEQIRELTDRAREVIPARVEHFAPLVGVSYDRITIRCQKTRWGSCSSKGNLNFNCLLIDMPEDVLDYVIVHELCHRLEMNHSDRFWAEVTRVLPDYRKAHSWLKTYGGQYLAAAR